LTNPFQSSAKKAAMTQITVRGDGLTSDSGAQAQLVGLLDESRICEMLETVLGG
jgi:hypothetical protein